MATTTRVLYDYCGVMMLTLVVVWNAVHTEAAATLPPNTAEENLDGPVRGCDEPNRTERDCAQYPRCCEWNPDTDVCGTLTTFVGNELFCSDAREEEKEEEDANDHPEHTPPQNRTDEEQCDESKCVTQHHYSFESALNCYTGTDKYGEYYTPMCAEGYRPRILVDPDDDSLPVDVVYNTGTEERDISRDINTTESWQYFTCCPPRLLLDGGKTNATRLRRHCSNPVVVEHNTTMSHTTSACQGTTTMQPHVRHMQDHLHWDYNSKAALFITYTTVAAYICCDTMLDNNSSNNNNNITIQFLDDIECVPYNNKNYREAKITPNRYAGLHPIFCDDPEPGFHYPKYSSNGGGTTYECCTTANKAIPPFIKDTAFYATVIPQIILSALAGLVCTILSIALLIPLIQQWQDHARTGSSTTTMASSASAHGTGNFSPYNMYLIYLTLPDLALNVYLLWMYCGYAHQTFDPHFSGIVIAGFANTGYALENAMIVACSTANLYYNGVVAYSVFKLLRNTSRLVRHTPPSLTRVTFEAAGVYGFSILIFCVIFFLDEAVLQHFFEHRDFDTLFVTEFYLGLIVAYIIPIGIFFSILIVIKVQNYMPALTGRERELVRKCRYTCDVIIP